VLRLALPFQFLQALILGLLVLGLVKSVYLLLMEIATLFVALLYQNWD
jgi:hypothetical protein